jgi:addiction module HigA family antidote
MPKFNSISKKSISPVHPGEIVHERRRITAETALGTRHGLGEGGRLARHFHTNPEFWLNLQNFYDLELSRRSGKASEIEC